MRSLSIAFILLVTATLHAADRRSVAITFDDLPDITADEDTVARQMSMIKRLSRHLASRHIPAIGFVNEDKLLNDDEQPDPARIALIATWLDAGLQIGNHTFSHEDLHAVSVAEYEQDILRGERITRPLVERHGQTLHWFRHPYLNTGTTLAMRDEVNAFLSQHGYAVAPVTIDDSEWIYDEAYHRAHFWSRLRLRRSYVEYMARRFDFAESKSRLALGREVSQILLLHASTLNADVFDALFSMIEGRGYRFVSIDQALTDPAYSSPDTWAGGGVGWIERWAVTRGVPESEFENDPKVPDWVQKMAGTRDE